MTRTRGEAEAGLSLSLFAKLVKCWNPYGSGSVTRFVELRRGVPRVGAPIRNFITHSAMLALTGCATGGWVYVPAYTHYYFYEPRIATEPSSHVTGKQDAATIDLTVEGSGNTLSITTVPSRGDLGVIMGRWGDTTDYTGVLAWDAATRNNGSIPMRLWVAASCPTEGWVILPSKLRLVDPTKSLPDISLSEYLQPLPAALHPDSPVFTGHWRYTQLDSNREIRCVNGETVAFTAGFETTLTLTSLRIVFGDSLELDGRALHIPDIELSLIGGQTYKSTKAVSIPEVIIRSIPHK